MESSSKLSGLNWLLSLPPWDGVNYTPLSFTKILLEELGNPQNSYRTIHVAGTNGKGTVASLLNHIFVKTSYVQSVGLMSSPHILNVNERCQINSKHVSDSSLNLALLEVKKCCSRLAMTPTFFVAITAAIFKIFEERKVELAIIEVGLGGRMDATNLIHAPEIAIITSIGLDHQDQLGSSISEIALNKAGIIKKNSQLVLGKLENVAKSIILQEAKHKNVDVIFAEKLPLEISKFTNSNFVPEFFQDNLRIAISCTDILGVTPANLLEVLSDYYWPRRFNIWEQLQNDLTSIFILDGAHNPPGVEMFLQSLHAFYDKTEHKLERINLLFGFLERKEWSQCVEVIKLFLRKQKNIQISCAVICDIPDFVNGKAYYEYFECELVRNQTELRNYISKKSHGSQLVGVFGSLKLPNEIEEQLASEKFERISFVGNQTKKQTL